MSISKQKSRYNEFYDKKKRREKLFKHRIKSNAEKYFPPNLRKSNNKKPQNVGTYSIELESPNQRQNKTEINNNNMNEEKKIGSPTYKELQIIAMEQASNLHTSSEKQLAMKKIVGAVSIRDNPLVDHISGTLPIYQTDDWSFEQRTTCVIIVGICIITIFVTGITILGFMGYSG